MISSIFGGFRVGGRICETDGILTAYLLQHAPALSTDQTPSDHVGSGYQSRKELSVHKTVCRLQLWRLRLLMFSRRGWTTGVKMWIFKASASHQLLLQVTSHNPDRSPPVIGHIVKRRNAIFGHIARTPSNVPGHQALSCQVDLSLGRPPDRSWKRRPGRPPKPVSYTHLTLPTIYSV